MERAMKRAILQGEAAGQGPRCVICAAGPVGDAAPLRALLRPEDRVVAADGGLRLAERLGVRPVRLVADFDSLPEMKEPAEFPVKRLPEQKDDTDTLAAARWGLGEGYRDFLLLGATGGRLDHTVANLAVLLFLLRAGARARLADEWTLAEMLLPGAYTAAPLPGAHLSLLPYAGAVRGLTVTNAAYPLQNADLTPDFPLGISNEFGGPAGEPVGISFAKGILLAFLSHD